jgi:phosphoenolpyruvate carboxykinase (GTP)
MYVVPFSMGPLGSPIAHIGVAAHRLPVRGRQHAHHDPHGPGRPRRARRRRVGAVPALGRRPARCRRQRGRRARGRATREQVHRPLPRDREIWSYGSGYGGNALLGKKCFALRIASVMARDEGWMAEHMLILKLTNPDGEKKYVAARSRPPAARPTWPCSSPPSRAGSRDHRRRHRLDEVRRRRPPVRHQPRGRLLRRGPRHRRRHQPQRHRADRRQLDLHQRRAHRRRRRVVGGAHRRAAGPPHRLEGQRLDARVRAPAAHPNARFTAPAEQCPSIAPEWEDPAGVPIEAILFGGRRATNVPLVTEAFDWQHGVFLGATVSSEKTAAAAAPSASCARPVRHAAVLRLQHGRLLGTGSTSARPPIPTSCREDLLGQLVPQGRRRLVPVAGLRREQPGAQVGVRAARWHRRRRLGRLVVGQVQAIDGITKTTTMPVVNL